MNKKVPICLSVANRIIVRTNALNEWRYQRGLEQVKLTGKRLQKILYLCQLFWYIDHEECNMISENFYAWGTGPVIPQIYEFFPIYHDGITLHPLRNLEKYTLNEEEIDLINKVVDNTIDIDTETIIDYIQLTDVPWINIYNKYGIGKGVISKDSIKKYIRREEVQTEWLDFIQNRISYEELVLTKKN